MPERLQFLLLWFRQMLINEKQKISSTNTYQTHIEITTSRKNYIIDVDVAVLETNVFSSH